MTVSMTMDEYNAFVGGHEGEIEHLQEKMTQLEGHLDEKRELLSKNESELRKALQENTSFRDTIQRIDKLCCLTQEEKKKVEALHNEKCMLIEKMTRELRERMI